jgi:hypothetical protein
MWYLTFKWARRRHRKKSRAWEARYFGRFHPTRRGHWGFGNRVTGVCCLMRLVPSAASQFVGVVNRPAQERGRVRVQIRVD